MGMLEESIQKLELITGQLAHPMSLQHLNQSTRNSYTQCHGHTDIASLRVLPVYQCCVARFSDGAYIVLVYANGRARRY